MSTALPNMKQFRETLIRALRSGSKSEAMAILAGIVSSVGHDLQLDRATLFKVTDTIWKQAEDESATANRTMAEMLGPKGVAP